MKKRNSGADAKEKAEEIRRLEDEIKMLDEKFSLIKDYPEVAHDIIVTFYYDLAGGKIPEHKIIAAHKELIQDLDELLKELNECLNNGFNKFLINEFK
jgi:hypothetical protein